MQGFRGRRDHLSRGGGRGAPLAKGGLRGASAEQGRRLPSPRLVLESPEGGRRPRDVLGAERSTLEHRRLNAHRARLRGGRGWRGRAGGTAGVLGGSGSPFTFAFPRASPRERRKGVLQERCHF